MELSLALHVILCISSLGMRTDVKIFSLFSFFVDFIISVTFYSYKYFAPILSFVLEKKYRFLLLCNAIKYLKAIKC